MNMMKKKQKSQKRNHCDMMKKALVLCACMLLSWMPGKSCGIVSWPFYEPDVVSECNGGGVLKSLSASVAASNVFNTIASRYRGKVTLIQTWATWCGPCRQTMNLISSIKPSLISKGVKFVCVTGTTSPRSDFNSMYPNIQGDHYYLTENQLRGFMQTLGQSSYPSFVLLNKSGQIVWKMKGYYGNEIVASQILKYL